MLHAPLLPPATLLYAPACHHACCTHLFLLYASLTWTGYTFPTTHYLLSAPLYFHWHCNVSFSATSHLPATCAHTHSLLPHLFTTFACYTYITPARLWTGSHLLMVLLWLGYAGSSPGSFVLLHTHTALRHCACTRTTFF